MGYHGVAEFCFLELSPKLCHESRNNSAFESNMIKQFCFHGLLQTTITPIPANFPPPLRPKLAKNKGGGKLEGGEVF